MRIYIKHPEFFVKHSHNLVTLVPDSPGHFGKFSVIRNQSGDYKRVKTDSITYEVTEAELLGELLNNTLLREVALEDNLIEVGDYHQDDTGYLNYTLSWR
jgi:hypothetical protein